MSNFLSFMGFKGWKGLHIWALHLILCFGLYLYPHPLEPYELLMFKTFLVWIGTIMFFSPFINAWNHQKHLQEMVDFFHVLKAVDEVAKDIESNKYNHARQQHAAYAVDALKKKGIDPYDTHRSDEKAVKFWERIQKNRKKGSKLPDTSTDTAMPDVKPPKPDLYSNDGQGYQPERSTPREHPKRNHVTGEYNYIPERPKPSAAPPPKNQKRVIGFFEFIKNVREYNGLLLRLSKIDEPKKRPRPPGAE